MGTNQIGKNQKIVIFMSQEIRTASLARVVCDCMDDVEKLQPFLFLPPDTLANVRTQCRGSAIPSPDLSKWREDPQLRPQ